MENYLIRITEATDNWIQEFPTKFFSPNLSFIRKFCFLLEHSENFSEEKCNSMKFVIVNPKVVYCQNQASLILMYVT